MVRHMILNSVRMYRNMFNEKYGEVILTYDSKHYWRRDFFPQYKAGRKKGRENDDKDWDAIFEVLNKIKSEFKEISHTSILKYMVQKQMILLQHCVNILKQKKIVVKTKKL